MSSKAASRSRHNGLQWVIAGSILLAILVVDVIFTHNILTEPFPGHNDFMSRWEGARSFFVDGLSPYSEEASLNIQNRIYGRPVIENEDPGFFVYPFYTAFLVWPTVYMDYAWASAVWMVLLEVCLVAGLLLIINLYGWKPAPWLLGILLLWALLDYPAGRGLVLGQPSHVVYFLQMLALWGIVRGHDNVAGVALAASTLKPQMGFLLVPFLLLWALRGKRMRFFAAFIVTFALLMAASFVLQPDWFGDWVDQVRLYPEYTTAAYPDTGSPVWIITQHYLGLGDVGEWVVNLVFILPMLAAWLMVLVQKHEGRFLWAVALTLTVTHLVALRTATPHFVVFNLMLVFYMRQVNRRRGALAALGLMFAAMIFSWGLFLVTVQGRDTLEHPVMFLPLPLLMFGLLWITRGMWWQHAPRALPQTTEN